MPTRCGRTLRPLLQHDQLEVLEHCVAAFEAGGRWCWVEFFGATSGTGFDESALDGYATVIVQAQAIYLDQVFIDVNPNDWYVASDGGENFLYTLNHGLMSGYSDRPAFGPYDTITRGQVATILYRMPVSPSASPLRSAM